MPSAKQQCIANWMNTNIGVQFSTVQLAKDLGISLPTLLSFIKANPDRFAKFKHGQYIVQPASETIDNHTHNIASDTPPDQPLATQPADQLGFSQWLDSLATNGFVSTTTQTASIGHSINQPSPSDKTITTSDPFEW